MKRLIVLITLVSFIFSIQISYAAPLTSTLKDQQNVAVTIYNSNVGLVAVTIYNSNVGLVKDTRLIEFKPGIHELKFMDVAGKIDPTTVHIKSLINGSSLSVLEQNYEYDLLSPQKLLEKFVGQKVHLATINPETKKEEIVEATLLSSISLPLILKQKKRRLLKQPFSPPRGGISSRSETRSTSDIMEGFYFQKFLKI